MKLNESTTSSHMGANTRTFAMFPMWITGKNMEGDVFKIAFIFISKDLGHDKHQVINGLHTYFLCKGGAN